MPAEDFYVGSTASDYEANRSGSRTWRQEDLIVKSLLARHGISDESTLVDVPVGTGRFLHTYGEHGCRVIGFDISSDMLQLARERLSPSAHLVRAEIRRLPLGDELADAVVCVRFVHLVGRPMIKETAREISRITRSGGFVILGARVRNTEHDGKPRMTFRQHLAEYKRTLQHRRGRANSRSHSKRWLTRTLDRSGLVVRDEQEVTRYKDGTRYLMFLLEVTDESQKSKGSPLSVELFGLPGVGKSTLFETVKRDGQFPFSDGYGQMKELSFWECVRTRPVASVRLLARLVPSWKELSNHAPRRAVVTALRQLIAEVEGDQPICLFQEGTSHEVWRQLIRDGEISDQLMARLLPVADVTVFIESSLDTTAKRLSTKKRAGTISKDLMSQPVTSQLWQLAISSYARIRDAIESRGEQVIVLHNEGSADDGALELIEILRSVAEKSSTSCE